MAIEVLTKEDLEEFRMRLIADIKQILGVSQDQRGKLLKSFQVKNLLKISSGTLQNLRVNGTLPFTKVGGIIYYRYNDIMSIFEQRQKAKK